MVGSDPRLQHTGQNEVTCTPQDTDFANRIRALARDAARTVGNRDARPRELIELSRRIDELRQETQDPQFMHIDRWLQSAQNLIESHERSLEESDLGHSFR